MENGTDYYWTGRFDEVLNRFIEAGAESNATLISREAQRCDFGSFYSSKARRV